MSESQAARRRMPLHTRILLGLGVGAAAGVASNLLWAGSPTLDRVVDYVAQPVGQVFLRMLFMVVVPLVFTSLTLGVAGLGDLRRLGRVGGRTIGVFLATTTMAVVIGLTASNFVRPGDAIEPGVRAALLAEYGGAAAERTQLASGAFGINTFVNIVPRNPVDAAARGDMLGLIFFSLIFGIALTMIRKDAAELGVGVAGSEVVGLVPLEAILQAAADPGEHRGVVGHHRRAGRPVAHRQENVRSGPALSENPGVKAAARPRSCVLSGPWFYDAGYELCRLCESGAGRNDDCIVSPGNAQAGYGLCA